MAWYLIKQTDNFTFTYIYIVLEMENFILKSIYSPSLYEVQIYLATGWMIWGSSPVKGW
jgi:hypothetical protein